jgi:hypothetical protein
VIEYLHWVRQSVDVKRRLDHVIEWCRTPATVAMSRIVGHVLIFFNRPSDVSTRLWIHCFSGVYVYQNELTFLRPQLYPSLFRRIEKQHKHRIVLARPHILVLFIPRIRWRYRLLFWKQFQPDPRNEDISGYP